MELNIFKNKTIKYKSSAMADPFVIKHGKVKDAQLRDPSYRSDWTEESFLGGKDNSGGLVGKTFEDKNLRILFLFLFVFLFLLISRIVYLQVIKGDYYHALAEGNRVSIKSVEANRGIIYDRNLEPLVNNQANFVLYLIPIELPVDILERDNIVREIGEIIEEEGKDVEEPWFVVIKDNLSEISLKSYKAYEPLFVTDNIEYETAMKLYLLAGKTPGVSLVVKGKREYIHPDLGLEVDFDIKEFPLGSSLSHIIGYTGKVNQKDLEEEGDYSSIDYIGKTGIESYWEESLRGEKGKKYVEVDALGQEKKVIDEYFAKHGDNLILSIDSRLQVFSEYVLRKKLDQLGLSKGSVVIVDSKTGELLTLVSWPAYDNNIFARGIRSGEYKNFLENENQPLFNRAISGNFPSGSTIKPVFSAAALEEKIISENTSFLSNGGIRVSEWFFPDWKAGGHGYTNVRKAIAESVNTFYYYIGGGYGDFVGLGVDGLVKYSKLFGLGEVSGIDLPVEAAGFVPTREWKEEVKDEPWYIGDTYNFSIGQGNLLVTPIQVANFINVFASNGKLFVPHLVKGKILNGEIGNRENIASEIKRENFIDDYNLLVVKQGMRQAVTEGSARFLSDLPIEVAGKTGTAQWSNSHNNHAWFVGFAPYEDPEITIAVLVEEGGEGSAVAVPVAKEIIDWYFKNTGDRE